MKIIVVGALALALGLTGCSSGSESGAVAAPKPVADSALPGLLLSAKDVDAIMGTSGMTPQNPVDVMGDRRNLLPNLNCLGVWQVNEAPIYDPSHYKSLRQQMLRTPNSDQWDSLVVQSAVTYRTADAARAFFDESNSWPPLSRPRWNGRHPAAHLVIRAIIGASSPRSRRRCRRPP